MRAAVGHSDDVDTGDAIGAAIAQCAAQLGSVAPRAALLFASTTYDHAAVLGAVADRWPGLPLIGSSTDGEFSSRGGFARDSLLLVLLAGDGFTAQVGLGRELAADPRQAVRDALAGAERSPTVALTTFAPSSTSHSPPPQVALDPIASKRPPMTTVGSLPASLRIIDNIPVVVVFP